ncbi:protein amalgam-like [Tigriopus californicus]|uniref:protein amalgam-like n=1 Tax=Tigriopus californicus TaxID=6832 RepID=UPI0027DAA524|nr:protein amalgam-like [Tigriopus californicus]XP_059081717.1 protein amalgam-like [Tigriopus californicus]
MAKGTRSSRKTTTVAWNNANKNTTIGCWSKMDERHVLKRANNQHSRSPASLLELTKLSSAILFLICYLPNPVDAYQPGFISPLENTTVASGRSAHFTCVVKHLGGHKVAWLRSDSKAILAIHTHMVTNNPRMSVEHNGHNSWTLRLSNVQRNDSGIYMCQINTEPMTSQIGMLSVVEAPDILYNETSNDTIVLEGAGSRLRCEARGYPEPTVTWQRENGALIALRHESGKTERVERVEGTDLILNRLTRADMGAYLCIASNGIPSPVSKRIMVHVHFHPLVKVHDQIVATTLGSSVKLSCTVEASPQSVNFWVKRSSSLTEMDQPINPSRRFQPLEFKESDYSILMTLAIKDVRLSDLGNYTCIARNSMGSVKGTVSLQQMYIPSTTPLPTQMYLDEDLNRTDKHSKKKIDKRRKSKAKYEVEPNVHGRSGTDLSQPTYIYSVNSNQEEYIDSYEEGQSQWGQTMLNSVSMIRPLLIYSALGCLIVKML